MIDEAGVKTHGAYRKANKEVILGLLAKAGVEKAFGRPLDRATKYQLWHTLRETLFKDEFKQNIPMRRAEMLLVRMACHQHYAIPDEELEATPRVLLKILQAREDKYPPTVRISAAKTLLAVRHYGLDQLRVLNTMSEDVSDADAGPRRIHSPLPLPDAQGDGQ